MALKAALLVPYRGDGVERTRNWRIALRHWERLGIPIVTGDPPGEFDRARARNIAAERAGGWEVALFADADIVLDSIEQASLALSLCHATGSYVVAYSHLRYVTEEGTRAASAGDLIASCETDEQVALTWECCFAVRRDLWEQVGGFDERFRGYGSQGIAFYYACATFGGRQRVAGRAYHLAHPLVDRSREPHYVANQELVARYRSAVDRPEKMRKLLAEAR